MLQVYRFLSHLAQPIIWGLVHKRRLQGLEDPARYQERFGRSILKRGPQKKMVWFHAASVGETISIIPLLSAIKRERPEWQVLVTTITKTSAKILHPHLHDKLIHQYIPFDIPCWIGRFLKHWHPDVMMLVESELWPNLLHQVHQQGIPITLLNARLSDRSYRRWRKFSNVLQELLQHIDHIYAQSEKIVQHFKNLGVQHVTKMTNLKYTSPLLGYTSAALEQLQEMISGRPVFLSVSTHKGEEALIVASHQKIKEEFPNLLTIIVPRHPERAEKIVKLLGGASSSLRSMAQAITGETEFYIADTIGELGLFFELAPFVFVGGSFVARVAGHNPIEPSLFGCAVIVGPHMENFTEIMQDFGTSITTVSSGEALTYQVLTFLKEPETVELLGEAAQKVVDEKADVIQKILSIMDQKILLSMKEFI